MYSENPPRFVKTERDQRLWEEAEDIVSREYKVKYGSPAYWSLANRIFHRMKLRVGGGEWPVQGNPSPLYTYELLTHGDPAFAPHDGVLQNPGEDHAQEALQKIVRLFETGDVPAAVAYVTFPPPNIPLAHWSMGNRLICLQSDTNDARGFAQWKEVNRWVKKGAKAIYILRPKLVKKREEEMDDPEDKFKLIGFAAQPVFRIEDTDGEPVEYHQHPLPSTPLDAVARKWGIEVRSTFFDYSFYGSYSHSASRIELASPEETVFFHEMTHAADARLVQIVSGVEPAQEIVAELGAACLSRLVGRQPQWNGGRHYRYVQMFAQAMFPNLPPREAVGKACYKLIQRVAAALGLILDEMGYQPPSAQE